MSWWWKSSAPNASSAPPNTQEPETAWAVDVTAPSDAVHASDPVSEPPKESPSRDEQTNRELIAWLKEAEADLVGKREVAAVTKPSTKRTPERGDAVDDISPESLYPTEISCRSAFDYAFFCQSFGGQFVNVYRYGGFRKCSNHWEDFWICMRTRQWDKADREKAIKEHYRKKAVKYKQGPSSEDIWTVRTEAVKGAFQGDLEKMEVEIKLWKANNPGVVPPIESEI